MSIKPVIEADTARVGAAEKQLKEPANALEPSETAAEAITPPVAEIATPGQPESPKRQSSRTPVDHNPDAYHDWKKRRQRKDYAPKPGGGDWRKRPRTRGHPGDPDFVSLQARRVVAKFGGASALARLLAFLGRPYSPSAISRWCLPKGKDGKRGGTGGIIPTTAWPDVLHAARMEGIHITSEELDPRVRVREDRKLAKVRYSAKIPRAKPAAEPESSNQGETTDDSESRDNEAKAAFAVGDAGSSDGSCGSDEPGNPFQ